MKRIASSAVALAFAGAALVATSGAAQAADCGTAAQAAVYKTKTTAAVTAVTHDEKVIDVAAVPGVPAVPGTPAVPAVEEVSHVEHVLVTEAYDETVIDKEAYTTTEPGPWWNWSPNNYQGPQDFEPAFPTDPRGTWQGPHTNGGPIPDAEGTYNVSHGNSGRSSWFHRGAPVVTEHPAETHVVHHDAVYKDVKVIDVPASPEIPATPGTPAIPAVEEVSHVVTIVDKPAVPASSVKVLVKKAVAAGKPCATNKPRPVSVTSTPTPDELAFTGSDTTMTAGLGALLVLAGAGAAAGARKMARAKQ